MAQRNFARWLRRGGGALLLALTIMGLAPGALAPAAATDGSPGVPPVPPGMARIWIYRDYEPYQTLATPYVRLNGAVIGVSQPGGAFYRDVAPGSYQATVDSDGTDVNQFVTVGVGAGQQVFVKVLVSAFWNSGGGLSGAWWQRDTFYTWLMPPQTAEAELAHMPLYDGG